MMGRTATICNFDNKPGYLCRDGCRHVWVLYILMAAGFRCDICRTFESDDLKPESMRRFHDHHAECQASGAAQGRG